MHQADSMSPLERRAAISLAMVFAFRMLGLFMVLPVLATYGQGLSGATPVLIGMAIGCYGLTQAFLQIPFGMLSDRIGRKPVILFGLLLFALGGLVAAQADSIQQVIAGRVLQGAGAIAAAVMALVADLTQEQNRTKAMAMIGMSIGSAFAVAMVAGPVIAGMAGLHGVFLSTSALAVIGMLLVVFCVPTPQTPLRHREAGCGACGFYAGAA